MVDYDKEVERSKEIIENKKKIAVSILKKYFKPLHENNGNNWAKENDEDMLKLVEVISDIGYIDALVHSGKIMIDIFDKKE